MKSSKFPPRVYFALFICCACLLAACGNKGSLQPPIPAEPAVEPVVDSSQVLR